MPPWVGSDWVLLDEVDEASVASTWSWAGVAVLIAASTAFFLAAARNAPAREIAAVRALARASTAAFTLASTAAEARLWDRDTWVSALLAVPATAQAVLASVVCSSIDAEPSVAPFAVETAPTATAPATTAVVGRITLPRVSSEGDGACRWRPLYRVTGGTNLSLFGGQSATNPTVTFP